MLERSRRPTIDRPEMSANRGGGLEVDSDHRRYGAAILHDMIQGARDERFAADHA